MKKTTINDAIYKTVTIRPLCLKIIDTLEFQRLRNIKQCGVCHYVYPTAVHTRFDHSIGVYFLASQVTEALKQSKIANSDEDGTLTFVEDEEVMSDEDELCVQVAALCHDLGHGPFSHLWETFVHRATGERWKHEEMSIEIFDRIFDKIKEEKDVKYELRKIGVKDVEKMKNFIKRLILGECEKSDENKRFLFEIVANKKTNLDVDRWDYLLRDSLFFGVPCSVQYKRIISEMRIVGTPEGKRIAFRDKVMDDILEIFHSRMKMHRRCYQHKTCKNIETMLIDALRKADKVYLDNEKQLSKSHEDINLFLALSDGLFFDILRSENENLKNARKILERIHLRKLYTSLKPEEISRTLNPEEHDKFEEKLKEKHRYKFASVFRKVDMGIQGTNSLGNILFFRGRQLIKGDDKSCIRPKLELMTFCEKEIDEEKKKEIEKNVEEAYNDIIGNKHNNI